MRFTQLLFCAALLPGLLASCDRSTANSTATAPTPATTATSPSVGFLTYQCESGETLAAEYLDNYQAVVEYKGEVLPMTADMSASGAR